MSGSGKLSGAPRVTNVLDSMTSASRKPSLHAGGKQSKAPVLKPLAPRPKTKVTHVITEEEELHTAIWCRHGTDILTLMAIPA